MLIAIEGCDGCGKNAVAQELARCLGGGVLSFPDDNAVTGPMIRAYLNRRWHVAEDFRDAPRNPYFDALAFQALQIVNRLENLAHLANAAGPGGTPLVLTRYWQSGWVYGGIDGLDQAWLNQIHLIFPQPQINILLDVPCSVAMERQVGRDGRKRERYEGDEALVHRIVREYRRLWSRYEGWPTWRRVGADRPLADVVGECLELARAAEVRDDAP